MIFNKDLRDYFKKEDLITVARVEELFKITYPTAKNLIIQNELNGIVERIELGSKKSKDKNYVWRLK